MTADATGPQGERGARGERGPQGSVRLPGQQARAVVVLFIVGFCIAAAGLLWVAHQQGELEAQARLQARQRCISIAETVTIPIAVPLAGNPSRQEWATFEHVERERGMQLGCKLPAPTYVQARS